LEKKKRSKAFICWFSFLSSPSPHFRRFLIHAFFFLKVDELKRLERTIEEKEANLRFTNENLSKMSKEWNEVRASLERNLAQQDAEYKTQLSLLSMEHELIVKDLKQTSESTVSRLSKQMELSRAENEKKIENLQFELEKKTQESCDLESRLKECEEALSKDKDERIQRLLDIQHNLEKEIESLKAALDIKNEDLLKLRSQNNELTTKVEKCDELGKLVRKYKTDIEQLNEVLLNKQETER
jgi:chromosome segregation ATPase